MLNASPAVCVVCLPGLQQNRPYTALVIYENLHQQVKKPALIRILDELTEEGHLQSKGQSSRGGNVDVR
jgi:hypothetical protein